MQIPPFGFGPTEALKQVSQWLGNPAINQAIKDAAQKLGMKEVPSAASLQEALRQAGKWLERTAEPFFAGDASSSQRSLENGINATGELFHSRWTAFPLSQNACQLAAYLHSGYSQDLGIHQELQRLLIAATGAADALVVANIPTAVQLVVQSWMQDQDRRVSQIILPRVACLRLPVSGHATGVHLRTLIDAAGASVTEIGSSSDCLHDDYAKAIAGHDGSLVFQATPISGQNDQYAAVEHARVSQSTVCTLALDASLFDLDWAGAKTPALTRQWESGPDLIIAPTQFLIGGPEAAVILGKKSAIERIRPLVDQLGVSADRVTQALLHCTLSEALASEGWSKSPLGAVLSTSTANLENRAQRLAIQLQGLPAIARTEVATRDCRIGNGPWQALKLPSSILEIYPQGISAAALNETLNANRPAIWSQVFSDHIELVLRSVDPADDARLVESLSSLKPIN